MAFVFNGRRRRPGRFSSREPPSPHPAAAPAELLYTPPPPPLWPALLQDFSEQNALAAQAEEAVYGTSLAAVNSSSGALKATVRASPLPLAGLQLQLQFHLIEWHGRNSLTDWETPAVSQQQLDQQVSNCPAAPLGTLSAPSGRVLGLQILM